MFAPCQVSRWPNELHPDLGLPRSFRVVPDPELDALIGPLPEPRASIARWIIDTAWEALLCGARGVSYSRRRAWYADARQIGWPASYATMLPTVDHLERVGLVANLIAPPQPTRGLGNQQSWLALTSRAADWLMARGGVLGDRKAVHGRLVRLKHRTTGRFLPLSRTRFVRDLEREMAEINEAADEAGWTPNESHVIARRGHLTVVSGGKDGQAVWLNTGGRGFTQLLTENGRLKGWTCGRTYGWAMQNAPREIRRNGRVEGARVDEVDYSAMHPRLALIAAGQPAPPGLDLYEPISDRTGEERGLVKKAVLIGMNARSPRSAVGAIAAEAAKLDTNEAPDERHNARARRLVRCIGEIHPVLGELFGSDVGVHLMRTEATILRRAGLDLARNGVPSIPLHDALVIAEGQGHAAEEAMRRASFEVVGVEIPIKRLLAA